jgi:peptidoglycan/xylan/chitin deacetylase (PgdA/CDA1 family)
MYQKYIGFAVIALLGLAACHSVFNKDKSVATDSAVVEKKSVMPGNGGPATTVATETPEPRDSNLKYVYLTFDDGPDAGTLNCYDICKSKGIKATFFLIGEHAEYPRGKVILDTMKKDMRHFLFANHSYTHAGHNHYVNFYQHSAEALKDFLRSQDTLHISTPIARFPGNPSWVMSDKFRSTKLTKPLAKLMDSIGYNVMGWDVEWHFNKQSKPVQSAEQMAREVENTFATKNSFVKNHVVLLAHDRMFRDQNFKDSLAKMITILQSKKGYIFETADQYPLLKKGDKTLLAMRK